MRAIQLIKNVVLPGQFTLLNYIAGKIGPVFLRLIIKTIKRLLSKSGHLNVVRSGMAAAFVAGLIMSQLA